MLGTHLVIDSLSTKRSFGSAFDREAIATAAGLAVLEFDAGSAAFSSCCSRCSKRMSFAALRASRSALFAGVVALIAALICFNASDVAAE